MALFGPFWVLMLAFFLKLGRTIARCLIGIYGYVYIGSRVLYALYHKYVYVRNVHVHIVWYMATTLETSCCGSVNKDGDGRMF